MSPGVGGAAGRPAWLRDDPYLHAAGWRHGWTTAAGPDFAGAPDTAPHAAQVARIAAAVGLPAAAWVRQVHGDRVLRARAAGCLGEADALWSDEPGLGVVGRSADCPLVLLAGTRPDGSPLWGFAHASWRSTVAGITAALAAALAAAGLDPARGLACVCPSAGPCCYEVGDDVRDAARDALGAASAAWFRRRGDRWLFDLWRANAAQLEQAGWPATAIRVTGACTICDPVYPSHRRQAGRAGRFAAIIGAAAAPA